MQLVQINQTGDHIVAINPEQIVAIRLCGDGKQTVIHTTDGNSFTTTDSISSVISDVNHALALRPL